MKKLFAFLLLSQVAFSQNELQNKMDENGNKTGYWKNYSENEGVTYLSGEGNYQDGLKIGDWTFYYKSGSVRSRAQYLNGLENGKSISYFEDGNISEKGTMINNKWVGEYEEYTAPGKLRRRLNYNYEGKQEGKQLYLHEDGGISLEAIYKDGTRLRMRAYYPGGQLRELDVRDSIDQRFRENGTLSFERLSNGERKTDKYYYENGKLSNVSSFKNGKKDGVQTLYYKNGNVKFNCLYLDDHMLELRVAYNEDGSLANGDWKTYHENGSIEREGRCINGKPDGEHTLYDKGGNLTLKVHYKNGKPDGECNYYSRGNIYYSEFYSNGVFVSEKRNVN